MLILQGMEENCNFLETMPFFKSQISDMWSPTGMNWFKLVFYYYFLTLMSQKLVFNFFSIENPIEITTFWLEHIA